MSVKKVIKAQKKGGVLVLNASYEPLGTSPLTRVLLKISKDDSPYQVLEWEDGETLNGIYPKPSVVRLKYYIDLPGKIRKAMSNRDRIYIRDKFRCQYCANKFSAKDLTLDHVYPQARGGQDNADNLVAACKSCNNRKGCRTPDEARMPLLNPLTSYKVRLDRVQLCHYAEYRPEWRKYLFMEEIKEGEAVKPLREAA